VVEHDNEQLDEVSRTTLADTIASSVPAILAEFEAAVRAAGGPGGRDEPAVSQAVAHARQILERTTQEILGRAGPEPRHSLAREIGAGRAAADIHPNESMRATDLVFGIVVRRLAGRLTAAQIARAALVLHDVLARARRVAADAYVGVLLNRVGQAQVDERRRISRELHDHIAYGIGVAQRDLELFEIYRTKEPERALARARSARLRLVESLDAVRRTINELRLVEPMESLEKAITLFLESTMAPGLNWQVEVNGDEAWATTVTLETVFLIIRESLRNTIAHAGARHVCVRVDIAPDALWSSVTDDGKGLEAATGHGGGTGLLCMRERAALLRGTLTLNSAPGRGTRVELRVPLTLAAR
jgi:signal transduction histidine kinase